MDFFAVPTVTFGLLYAFFMISHNRRRILHVSVWSIAQPALPLALIHERETGT